MKLKLPEDVLARSRNRRKPRIETRRKRAIADYLTGKISVTACKRKLLT